MAIPNDTSSNPVCHTPEEEGERCVVCYDRVCPECGVSFSENQWFCSACGALWGALKQASPTKKTFVPSLIPDSQNVSLALSFCFLLAVVYFISAFPVWFVARLEFLSVAGLDRSAILEGYEYWRLVTANLFHVDLAHLGLNLFSLFVFGRLLELQIGRGMLFGWMMISIVGCDIASLLFLVPNSVGASGIAYGLQTAFIVLTGKTLIVNRLQGIRKTLQSLLGYLLIIVLVNVVYTEHINIYGHFGGALAGGLCALIYPVSRPPDRKDYYGMIALFGAWLGGLILLLAG